MRTPSTATAAATATATLDRQIERELVRHVFTRGQGAQLLFLWVTGLGLLLLVWPSAAHAAIWTGLAAALAGLIVREQRAHVAPRRRAAGAVLARRFPTEALADHALRAWIRRSHVLMVELLVTTRGVRSRGEETALAQVMADAEGLVALQLESAQQAEELERLLALVEGEGGPGRDGREDRGAGSLRTAVSGVRTEAAEARANVEQIRQQLETLLLQVARLERRPSDLVHTAQVTHAAGQTLARLRDIVDARRKAANEVADLFLPAGLQR